MIRVTIELIPCGHEERAEKINIIEIARDMDCDGRIADYDVAIYSCHKGQPEAEPRKVLRINDFDADNHAGAIGLLRTVLEQEEKEFREECRRKEIFIWHGRRF